jgi:hypothetical protein
VQIAKLRKLQVDLFLKKVILMIASLNFILTSSFDIEKKNMVYMSYTLVENTRIETKTSWLLYF